MRPELSNRCRAIVKKLKEMCERASAPPHALYKLFTRYDADGSGNIAYDELVEMVRDTGTNIVGRDMVSEFLDRFSEGQGEIPYGKFIVKVLGLQADALRTGTAAKRLVTAEVVTHVSDGVKRAIQRDRNAVERVFKTFDKDGAGVMRFAEFCDGVKSMGLPISRPQMKKLFHEFDKEGGGTLDQDEFAKYMLGIEEGTPPASAPRGSPNPAIPASPPLRTGSVSSLGSHRMKSTDLSPQRPKTIASNADVSPFSSPFLPRDTSRSPNKRPAGARSSGPPATLGAQAWITQSGSPASYRGSPASARAKAVGSFSLAKM